MAVWQLHGVLHQCRHQWVQELLWRVIEVDLWNKKSNQNKAKVEKQETPNEEVVKDEPEHTIYQQEPPYQYSHMDPPYQYSIQIPYYQRSRMERQQLHNERIRQLSQFIA